MDLFPLIGHVSQKLAKLCLMFSFKLETHTSVPVRLQGMRNLHSKDLLKVIKGMKVIRGDYSHSPSLMFEIVSLNIQ